MHTYPTLERLRAIRLHGMADAYAEQIEQKDIEAMTFDERLGLLVDREASDRESRRLTNRLRRARLRQSASIEDIDYAAARGLEKSVVRALARCHYLREHQNVLIVGPTGTGKTYLACALAHKACLEGFTARYHRLSSLLADMEIAKADGSYPKWMRELAKTDALTGLPEYRNGGLLIDCGVIVPRDPRDLARSWKPGDEFVVEWRALTVTLLDELATLVRQRLGKTADELPLACILEGGTWAAGREVAAELRGDGAPPVNIDSDGTVF